MTSVERLLELASRSQEFQSAEAPNDSYFVWLKEVELCLLTINGCADLLSRFRDIEADRIGKNGSSTAFQRTLRKTASDIEAILMVAASRLNQQS